MISVGAMVQLGTLVMMQLPELLELLEVLDELDDELLDDELVLELDELLLELPLLDDPPPQPESVSAPSTPKAWRRLK